VDPELQKQKTIDLINQDAGEQLRLLQEGLAPGEAVGPEQIAQARLNAVLQHGLQTATDPKSGAKLYQLPSGEWVPL
jgi:hypothetical protein